MTRKLISSGSRFEAQIGYLRAVVVDDWVFVSGTTRFDHSTTSIVEGIVEQTEQRFVHPTSGATMNRRSLRARGGSLARTREPRHLRQP
jgi:hypothetical protein